MRIRGRSDAGRIRQHFHAAAGRISDRQHDERQIRHGRGTTALPYARRPVHQCGTLQHIFDQCRGGQAEHIAIHPSGNYNRRDADDQGYSQLAWWIWRSRKWKIQLWRLRPVLDFIQHYTFLQKNSRRVSDANRHGPVAALTCLLPIQPSRRRVIAPEIQHARRPLP